MELPEDILQLIREYSRPRFKYFREYQNTLRLCAFHEWKDLRYALQVNPEKVLSCIRAHEKVQSIWLQAYHEDLNLEEKIRRGYYAKKDARTRTFQELVKHIGN